MPDHLLTVSNLSVEFHTRAGVNYAVNDVSFHLDAGETLGIVGESGSGKSVTCSALMGLLPSPPAVIPAHARALFAGMDLLHAPEKQHARLRGRRISMIFQDPMTSLNPCMTIGDQVAEPLVLHRGMGWKQARRLAVEELARTGIPEPEKRYEEYPFQFSGGMTVKPAEWNTTDDVQPTSSTRLHAVGDVTLSVTGNCWYGPKPGVETQTVAEDRAMLIDAGATLTLTTADGALVLADPIRGAGTLRFADGAVLEPAGALALLPGVWTEIARVGAIEGLPVCGDIRFKTVENDDGTVSLLAKPFSGALIILR